MSAARGRFLFESGSAFDRLCPSLVTALKKHPHVKRVYVRAEYPIIGEAYEAQLLKRYDETYYPEKLLRAGRAVYVERNREMIRKSHCCIVYYDDEKAASVKKSGTKRALSYAEQQKKEILLFRS